MNKVFNKILIFLNIGSLMMFFTHTNIYPNTLNLDALKSRKSATLAQEILFNKANKQADVPKAVVKLINGKSAKIKNYQMANARTVFMMSTPNLDDRLFTLYHELGHAMDPVREQKAHLLTETLFTEPIPELDHYLTLGQKVLDRSSSIGSLIKDAIEQAHTERSLEKTLRNVLSLMLAPVTILETFITKYLQDAKKTAAINLKQIGQFAIESVRQQRIFHPFWTQPRTVDKLQSYLFWRRSEQFADLFALQRLYEQNKLQTIMRWIEYTISCNHHTELCALPELYIVSETYPDGTQDKHPSNIERAVYIIGFLAAHGVDVNRALRDYEANGTCIDGENLKMTLDYLKPQKCPATN